VTDAGQRRWLGRALVLLLVAYVVVPRLVQSATAPKYKALLGSDTAVYSPLAQRTDLALFGAVVLLCLIIVLVHLERLPRSGGLVLGVLLAPWFYVVLLDLVRHGGFKRAALLYPVVVVAVRVLSPALEDLALLGYLVGGVAALSLLMGWLVPELAIYRAQSGELLTPEKLIVPWGVLVGPLSNGNNLGQLLTLGLPTVFLVRRRLHAAVLATLTLAALVWTASRSSLLAAAVVLVTALLLRAGDRPWRRVVAGCVLLALVTTVVALPLSTSDPTAFSNRGGIWAASLDYWRTSPLTGLGSTFYASVSDVVNTLGPTAFHGHNQFVHVLTTGGLVYLALLTVLFTTLAYRAVVWVAAGQPFPVLSLASLATSCTLEVSFGVVDRTFLIAVTTLPIAWIAFGHGETRRSGPQETAAPLVRRPRTGAPVADGTRP